MDDFVSSLVDVVGVIQRREPSEGDPMVSRFSEYIDLNKPFPDPDAKRCDS